MSAKQMTVTGRLIEVFGNTWAAIQRRHPEVPNVMITIGSGTEQKGKARWGHFQADIWEQIETGTVAELFVSGEGLQRGGLAVLGTLLHEAAHGVAYTRQVQDTSRQGRYHNRRFQQIATELGLDAVEDTRFGWSITSVPAQTGKAYVRQLEAIGKALVAWRRAEVHPENEKKSTNLAVATCACDEPRKIRVAKSTLDAAPILCGACSTEFSIDA